MVVWRAFPSCHDWIKCLISKSRFSPGAIANVQRQQNENSYGVCFIICCKFLSRNVSICCLNKGLERTVQNWLIYLSHAWIAVKNSKCITWCNYIHCLSINIYPSFVYKKRLNGLSNRMLIIVSNEYIYWRISNTVNNFII